VLLYHKKNKGGDILDKKITLKAARVNAGLTQEEVAKEMKVSLPTITKWENESGEVRMKQALKLCKLYKKNIDDIFFG